MLTNKPFAGEAGLIVLDDLKAQDFNLAIMKARKESIFEDSRLLDYLGVPRLVLTPSWETSTLEMMDQIPLQKYRELLYIQSGDMESATLSFDTLFNELSDLYNDFYE